MRRFFWPQYLVEPQWTEGLVEKNRLQIIQSIRPKRFVSHQFKAIGGNDCLAWVHTMIYTKILQQGGDGVPNGP
jgi:hypothetical protein